MKTFIIIAILSSFLMGISKCDNDAPKPPKNIKVWVGDSEIVSICRINDTTDEVECIKTDTKHFDQYLCMTDEDHEKVLNYIIELNDKCKSWKK